MDNVSVSKGVFVNNKFRFGQKKDRTTFDFHKSKPWYKVFKETCSVIQDAANKVNEKALRQIVVDVESFVYKIKQLPLMMNEIPTGILLAGINLSDHNVLVQGIVSNLQTVTPYIATVWSRDANTLKNLIEEIVYQLINSTKDDASHVKRSQCNFCTLNAWCKEYVNVNIPLIIMLPDFESFSAKILHDLVLILSSYLKSIKFVLLFGVATTLHVVHHSLSYDATSKLNVEVFSTQTQVQSLSDVLNGIVHSPDVPFKLTGRAFKLLVEIFLYYDFSVNGFLQSYKICIWKHFYEQNEKIICCNRKDIKNRVSLLTSNNLHHLKKFPSVKSYLRTTEQMGISDEKFRVMLINLLEEFHIYMDNFLIVLKCLHNLSMKVPNELFGTFFREIYEVAVGNESICETQRYKEVIQLINLFSKEELLFNIKSILTILNEQKIVLDDVPDKLNYYMKLIKDASLDVVSIIEEEQPMNKISSRTQFRQILKTNSQQSVQSPFKEAQAEFIEYLDKQVFSKYLRNPKQVPLNEIFCFNDVDTINRCIRGSIKSAIHNGLNDPQFILGCDCCSPDIGSLATQPDLSIIYKLHLEFRKMINMHDWLQTFILVLNPNNTENIEEVDPVLYARFASAVAELQFLGYIKATQKKTDHVKRLT